MISLHSSGVDASASDGARNQTAQAPYLALFASDLHLHPSLPKTTQEFFRFLSQHAIHAEKLYLLGDLFEYWAGDDDLQTPFNREVAGEIRTLAEAGVAVFWIAGNRDFLIGERFASEAKLTLLPDPYMMRIGAQNILLTHGDALCTDDASYMAFRAQVRSQTWQHAFLSRPLEERKAIIEGMRTGSKEAQCMKTADIMDVNVQAVAELFRSSKAMVMIHGHTHRPAKHVITLDGQQRSRWVLPDWDYDMQPPRGGWIGIDRLGDIRSYAPTGNDDKKLIKV